MLLAGGAALAAGTAIGPATAQHASDAGWATLGVGGPVLGTVAEWTSDWVDPTQTWPATNPVNAEGETERRIVRGGAWASPGFALRSAIRSMQPPEARLPIIGFRLVPTVW